MHVSRARCSALIFSAILALGSVLSGPAMAQAPAVSTGVQQGLTAAPSAASRSGVVNRIIVQGNERIEESTILSYLTIQPGQTVTDASVDAAEKTLANTGLFADESIELQANGDLVVRGTENPFMYLVVFEGNHYLKEV